MRPRNTRSPAGEWSLLPDNLAREIGRHFAPRRARYVAAVLSVDELKVIRDLRDALIIARIKRMPLGRLTRFDKFVPSGRHNQIAYERAQLDWLHDEQYLLGRELGRSPTHQELSEDFRRNQNGLRFRAYFTLKNPEKMRRNDRAA